MFEKIAVIEPINFDADAFEKLPLYAKEVVLFDDLPGSDEEIIQRVGQADCMLVSYTTKINARVIQACPRLKYIGMCCSLYDAKSANVDIEAAEQRGVVVTGVRDYGDEGVAEYVISELVRFLHGFYGPGWRQFPLEITNLKAGIVGMGATGDIIGRALRYFGAEVSYFSRTRKPELEQRHGYRYLPLDALLGQSSVLFTCLTRSTVVLREAEFKRFGHGKILFNTSMAPTYDMQALASWLANTDNHIFCDTVSALGGESLLSLLNAHCPRQSSGITLQAKGRLGVKALQNIRNFLQNPAVYRA